MKELADHWAVLGVEVKNLGEIDNWGETVENGTGIPTWLKASGVAIGGAAVVVSTGVLTDNLTDWW